MFGSLPHGFQQAEQISNAAMSEVSYWSQVAFRRQSYLLVTNIHANKQYEKCCLMLKCSTLHPVTIHIGLDRMIAPCSYVATIQACVLPYDHPLPQVKISAGELSS